MCFSFYSVGDYTKMKKKEFSSDFLLLDGKMTATKM